MELYNRRLLLLNEDEPSSTISPHPLLQDPDPSSADSSSPPGLMAAPSSSPSSSLSRWPLKLPAPSAFNPNVAYTFIILITALFLMGFLSLYVRRFADDSPSAESFFIRRRRRQLSPLSSSYYSPSAPCGGLGHSTIQSLPVFAYQGEAKHQVDCAICLGEFQDGEAVKMIPHCKHVFHPECIEAWLSSHVTCPICRGTKFFTVKESVELGKAKRGGDEGVVDHQRGWTVEDGREIRVVGSQSLRRSSSCSSLRDTVVLPRTLSY